LSLGVSLKRRVRRNGRLAAAVVLLALASEAFTLYWIRDNLTLNVIMVLWPPDAIRAWQAGA